MKKLNRIIELQNKTREVAYDLHAIAIDGQFYELEYVQHLYDDEETVFYLYQRQDTQNVKITMTISQLAQAINVQFYTLKEL